MKIKQQTAIISGAASGMGEACARLLHDQGCPLILIDLNESVLQLAKELESTAILCDIASPVELAEKINLAVNEQGTPRIAINCAGIAPAKRIVGREGPQALEEFSRVINTNLIGTFNFMRLVAHAMTSLEPLGDSDERGVIINTASVAAYEGQIGQAAYSASKGGVVSMTLPAAREFAQFGIRVNTIAPGLIATPLLLNMPEEVQESLAAQVPFPKRLGRAEEFARLACHIIENEMINGTVIRLDGAIRMQAK